MSDIECFGDEGEDNEVINGLLEDVLSALSENDVGSDSCQPCYITPLKLLIQVSNVERLSSTEVNVFLPTSPIPSPGRLHCICPFNSLVLPRRAITENIVIHSFLLDPPPVCSSFSLSCMLPCLALTFPPEPVDASTHNDLQTMTIFGKKKALNAKLWTHLTKVQQTSQFPFYRPNRTAIIKEDCFIEQRKFTIVLEKNRPNLFVNNERLVPSKQLLLRVPVLHHFNKRKSIQNQKSSETEKDDDTLEQEIFRVIDVDGRTSVDIYTNYIPHMENHMNRIYLQPEPSNQDRKVKDKA